MTAAAEMTSELNSVESAISSGALFVVNHSGGKDSQAMLSRLASRISASQILVIHAHLPEVEWPGTWEHVQATSRDWGLEPVRVTAGKTFFEMVERRGRWPSAAARQCTSDLKRDPIDKAVRAFLRDNPRFGGQVVSCMGMRAEESTARSRQAVWKRDTRNSRAGRSWWRWLPIHGLSTPEVFRMIADAGQTPHWAYGAGMSRLSCCFCIMSNQADLRTAARTIPSLYGRYVDLEKRLGHTLRMDGRGLESIVDPGPGDLL